MHYPNVEFVVLDYNSKDGMENWVKEKMSKYIASGILKYYKTYDPAYFDLPHSKNMVLRLATGKILCLVDADNYAGPDYVHWVNSGFLQNGDNTIITTIRKDRIPYKDQGGKLAFSSDLVYSVTGFDESLVGYGMDDVDLVNRLEKSGGKRLFIEQEKYLKFIGHSDMERLKNHRLLNDLEGIYINGPEEDENQSGATVLYLLRQESFFEVSYDFDNSLKKNWVESFGGWSVGKNGQRNGSVKPVKGGFTLTYTDSSTVTYMEREAGVLSSLQAGKESTWKKITRDNSLYYFIVKGYGECVNRIKYIENDLSKGSINHDGWGKGTAYLNFDTDHPVTVD